MAIEYVNSTSGHHDFGGTPLTLDTAPFVVTSGNCIVFGVFAYSDGVDCLSVTDTAGNVYTKMGASYTDGSQCSSMWVAKNVIGNASNIVTAHYEASSAYERVIAIQMSGVSLTDPSDSGFAPADGYDGGKPLCTSYSGTTTVDGEWVIGFFVYNSGGYTERLPSVLRIIDNNGWDNACLTTNYIETAGTGDVSVNFSGNAFTLARAIKPAVGGTSANYDVSVNLDTVKSKTLSGLGTGRCAVSVGTTRIQAQSSSRGAKDTVSMSKTVATAPVNKGNLNSVLSIGTIKATTDIGLSATGGSLALAKIPALVDAGIGNSSAAYSIALIRAVLDAGSSASSGQLTLSKTVSTTSLATLLTQVIVSLSKAISEAHFGSSNSLGSSVTSRTSTVSFSLGSSTEVDVQLSKIIAETFLTQLQVRDLLSLSKIDSISNSGKATSAGNCSISKITVVLSSLGSNVAVLVQLSKSIDIAESHRLNFNDALLLNQIKEVLNSLNTNVNTSTSIAKTLSTDIVGQCLALAMLTVGYSINVSGTDSSTIITITTPNNRTIVIQIENREIVIQNENREILIKNENREIII